MLTKHGEFLVVLHAFIKKAGKTLIKELELTRHRLAQLRGEHE